jgi:hypothetical protein
LILAPSICRQHIPTFSLTAGNKSNSQAECVRQIPPTRHAHPPVRPTLFTPPDTLALALKPAGHTLAQTCGAIAACGGSSEVSPPPARRPPSSPMTRALAAPRVALATRSIRLGLRLRQPPPGRERQLVRFGPLTPPADPWPSPVTCGAAGPGGRPPGGAVRGVSGRAFAAPAGRCGQRAGILDLPLVAAEAA